MKKLNRKGFTLIELLAVVVILAVILVVTIPSVLDTMQTSKEKSFNDAVEIIVDYAQKTYDQCYIAGVTTTAITKSVSSCTTGCTCNIDNTKIIEEAGYNTTDISKIVLTVSNNKVSLTCAKVGASGNFAQGTVPTTGC